MYQVLHSANFKMLLAPIYHAIVNIFNIVNAI